MIVTPSPIDKTYKIDISDLDLVYDTIHKELVINENIDLNQSLLEIPVGYSLYVKQGRILNGIIKGNNTKLRCDSLGSIGVILHGSWQIIDIKDTYFDTSILTDKQILENLNVLQSDTISQNVILSKKEYYAPIYTPSDCLLRLSSNTNIFLNTTIKLAPNNFPSYSIIEIRNKTNINLIGGIIQGDIKDHKYVGSSTHEWGMGVFIMSSSNINIENTYISMCTGDGIYIGGGDESSISNNTFASKNISLKSVICDNNRRQGLSIIHADGMTICQSRFVNTGKIKATPPSAGLDIEPNLTNGRNNSVRNIKIYDCKFINNVGRSLEADLGVIDGNDMNIENILIEKCAFDNSVRIGTPNILFKECDFVDVEIRPYEAFVDCEFVSCRVTNGLFLQKRHSHTPLYKSSIIGQPIRNISFKNCIIHPNSQTGIVINVECSTDDIKSIRLFNSILNIDVKEALVTLGYEPIVQNEVKI